MIFVLKYEITFIRARLTVKCSLKDYKYVKELFQKVINK